MKRISAATSFDVNLHIFLQWKQPNCHLFGQTLSPSIAALINKSILTGKFPDKLKIAKVFPIHKSGSKSDPCNYRPISILPTISKIFERHVNRHLMSYLNKYCLIHETQSGFRQKHSCQTALVKLIDQWLACIDKGDIVGSIFIDFRKAFDLVDHKTLIRKLSTYKHTVHTIRRKQTDTEKTVVYQSACLLADEYFCLFCSH